MSRILHIPAGQLVKGDVLTYDDKPQATVVHVRPNAKGRLTGVVLAIMPIKKGDRPEVRYWSPSARIPVSR